MITLVFEHQILGGPILHAAFVLVHIIEVHAAELVLFHVVDPLAVRVLGAQSKAAIGRLEAVGVHAVATIGAALRLPEQLRILGRALVLAFDFERGIDGAIWGALRNADLEGGGRTSGDRSREDGAGEGGEGDGGEDDLHGCLNNVYSGVGAEQDMLEMTV